MKASLLSLLALLCTTALVAQIPLNDDCSGIVDLGELPLCSDPAQYTNVNATASVIDPVFNLPACFTGVQRDVWFQFTVPADGSITDVTVSVFGNVGGNGTLQNPQVAIYRGDCVVGGLAELDCISAPNGTNEVSIDLFGLTPGLTYFLRINDYSATAAPNSGTFRLCVEEYVPDIIMGETLQTQSCTGTLYDSGGETNDYTNNEDLTFTICPQDFHQCIVLNVETYNTENGADPLRFYLGDDITDPQLTQISGSGSNFEVQFNSACATVRFTSDFSLVDAGFKITWACSSSPCTAPPITTCADPVIIPALPYDAPGISNCFSGNTINTDPCGSTFLGGNDYVMSYTSPGDECVTVSASGTNTGVGLGIYDNCPTLANSSCIASAGGQFGGGNPFIQAAYLEQPGTYYFVFSSANACSQFDLNIDTVTCPVLLPPASTCEDALNLGGCSTTLPEIIALNPGAGDPDFIQTGVNDGCLLAPQGNFAFFYFVAGADGQFGFTVQSADPNEASDIDFNVWGPIDSPEQICEHVTFEQPVRSSWAGGADPTGLQDVHPVLGTPVTDDFDCGGIGQPGAGGDDFVQTLPVQEGKIYVVLLDDFGNAIENGGISIDFSGTTAGVFEPLNALVTAGPDTAICLGQPVQLVATGGEAYAWSPDGTLSCSNCPNPVATPTETTLYDVQIVTTCKIIPQTVEVAVYEVTLGPDVTVCQSADFQLNPNPFPGVQYTWAGLNLSCFDCPTPTVSGLTVPALYTYFATLTTPFCTLYDTLQVTVIPGLQPQYEIADNQAVCAGVSVQLGGNDIAGTNYSWSSVPSGFTSTAANPTVAPTQTTKYFLTASNSSCSVPAIDSVLVTIFQIPQLSTIGDTTICQGESVLLGSTIAVDTVNYVWSASTGVPLDPDEVNPLVTPQQNTTYTLTANNGTCVETRTVEVGIIPIFLQLNVADTVQICQGSTLNIQANVNPTGTPVSWSPNTALVVAPGNLSAQATPYETTQYTVTASVPGCTRVSTVYVAVDSLPDNLDINPADTTVCFGSKVLLRSTLYEPAEYPNINFTWTPTDGQLTPDSLYNMFVQPSQTTVYRRITQSGACYDTSFAVVQIIPLAEMKIVPADTTVCPGQPVQLTLTYTPGVEDIKWEPADNLTCDDCDNPVATLVSTTNISVSGTFQGCTTGASATINVLTPPGVQFPSDTQLCAGESTTLNSATTPNTTYSWTSTDPNFVPTSNPQPSVTPSQTATYTVVASNGCAVEATVTLTVSDAQLTVKQDTTVCKNLPVQLTATGTLPGTYNWSSGETAQNIVVTPQATTPYTVVYTYGDGCTKTGTVTVTLNGEAVQLDLPVQPTLCPGGSVTLNNASVPPAATFNWTATPPDPTLAATAGNPTVAPTTTTTYTVTATQGLCVSTGTVVVTAQSGTLTVPEDQTLCPGETLTLTAVGTSNTAQNSFSWTPPGTNGGSGPSITVDAPGTYTVVYEYGNDCTLTDQVVVTPAAVFTLAIVSAPPGPSVGLGENVELTAVVTPANQNFQYQWFQNGTTPIGSTQVINTVVSTPDTSIRYQVIATSPAGCSLTEEIIFSVEQPEVVYPNAFTPDGDNLNDQFAPLVLTGDIEVVKFEIFNRWGQRIFTSKSLTDKWDGTVDGKPAPVDTYIYQFQWRSLDGALRAPVVGEVTLLR